jgi:hypothetical protein
MTKPSGGDMSSYNCLDPESLHGLPARRCGRALSIMVVPTLRER